MPHYRIYAITAENHIFGAPATIHSDNDGEAIATARSLMNGRALELWDGARYVARLEPNSRSWSAVKAVLSR